MSAVLITVTPKTSEFRGVHWCSSKKKWRAEIEVNGRAHKLGRHTLEWRAAEAYDAAAVKFGVPERCNTWWGNDAANAGLPSLTGRGV